MIIQEIDDELRKHVVQFRGSIVVSRGKVHLLEELPGYAAILDGKMVGLVTFHIAGKQLEIVSLDSKLENQGIGGRLIDKVVERARADGCQRVWLITSNDNIRAIRFYQKRGFDMKAIHRNAITEARKIKPSIPFIGFDGIPVKHEIEFELLLEA